MVEGSSLSKLCCSNSVQINFSPFMGRQEFITSLQNLILVLLVFHSFESKLLFFYFNKPKS